MLVIKRTRLSPRCSSIKGQKMFGTLPPIRVIIGLILVLASTIFTARAQPVIAPISDIAWNADGSLVALARDDGNLEIVSTQGESPNYLSVSSNNLISVAWSPSQRNRFAVSAYMGDVQVFDVSGEQFTQVYDLAAEELYVRQVEWSPDGNYLAIFGETGGGASSITRVRIWDNSTGNLLVTYEDYYSLTDIAWNPQNANQLLITGITNREGAEIFVWDVSNDTVIWKMKEPDSEVLYIAWKADATEFATTSDTEDGALVRIHDASNGAAIATVETEMMSSRTLSWSPSPYLAIADSREIQIWDTEAPRLITSIQPSNYITTVVWSPDGTQLAYGGTGGTVSIVPIIASSPTNNITPTSGETPISNSK